MMQARQKQLIESFKRVKVFLEANPAPTAPGLTEATASLDAAVAELTEHSSAQLLGRQMSKSGRTRVEKLMRKLREHHMQPIVAIARAEIEAQPEIAPAHRMPHNGSNALRLLAAANAMKDAAALFAPVFIKAGRPADFIAQLTAAMEAIEQAVSGQARSIGTRIGANAGLAQQLRRGRRAVDVLDPIVKMAFEGNEVVLAQWLAAKRVHGLRVTLPEDVPGAAEPVVQAPTSLIQTPPAAA